MDTGPVTTASAGDLVEVVGELIAELRALRAELARRGPAPPEVPVTTWQDVAAACGVSVHTLMRRRRERSDKTRPYFTDFAAAREWYANLVQGPVAPLPTPSKRSARPQSTRPIGQESMDGPTVGELLAKKRGRGASDRRAHVVIVAEPDLPSGDTAAEARAHQPKSKAVTLRGGATSAPGPSRRGPDAV